LLQYRLRYRLKPSVLILSFVELDHSHWISIYRGHKSVAQRACLVELLDEVGSLRIYRPLFFFWVFWLMRESFVPYREHDFVFVTSVVSNEARLRIRPVRRPCFRSGYRLCSSNDLGQLSSNTK